MPRNPTTSFRFTQTELEVLAQLAERLGLTRTDTLREALAAFAMMVPTAELDAVATLTVLRERYGPEAEVAVWADDPGTGPEGHVRINGAVQGDVGAIAIPAPHEAAVFLFLQVVDAHAHALVPVGRSDTLIVSASFPVGKLAFPAPGLRIVLQLKDLKPVVSPKLAAQVEVGV
jgi:hypothetical protein